MPLVLALLKTQQEFKHCHSLWHLPLPTVSDSDSCLIIIPILLTWELILLCTYGTVGPAQGSQHTSKSLLNIQLMTS